MRTASYLASLERQANEKEAKENRERIERDAVRAGRTETITLRRMRGEMIEEPKPKRGEREKPAKVRDGWDLARDSYVKDGRLALAIVGDRYAAIYRTAHTTPFKIGCEPYIKGADTGRESRADQAKAELNKIRRDALAGLGPFIQTVDAVCGEGRLLLDLAGAKHAIPVHKDRLTNALALIGVYWRMEV